jgi:hypothetical protein
MLFDRTLQALVDKVFSDLEQADRMNEEAYYARMGIKRKPDPEDAAGAPGADAPPAGGAKAKRSRGAIDIEINFKLSPDEDAAGAPESAALGNLDKPYLKTCGRLKVAQLKKYLSKKLHVQRADEIEVLCRGDVLGSELSLQFIKRTRWSNQSEDLELSFRRRTADAAFN